jgi:hypothetical protein
LATLSVLIPKLTAIGKTSVSWSLSRLIPWVEKAGGGGGSSPCTHVPWWRREEEKEAAAPAHMCEGQPRWECQEPFLTVWWLLPDARAALTVCTREEAWALSWPGSWEHCILAPVWE